MVVPFLLVFGLSYFFVQFGPNVTTFVLPSEIFPVNMRTTGHGIAAGMGKLGAFLGVFLVPVLKKSIGLRGMLLVAACAAVGGVLLTLPLPDLLNNQSLEDLSEQGMARRVVLSEVVPNRDCADGHRTHGCCRRDLSSPRSIASRRVCVSHTFVHPTFPVISNIRA